MFDDARSTWWRVRARVQSITLDDSITWNTEGCGHMVRGCEMREGWVWRSAANHRHMPQHEVHEWHANAVYPERNTWYQDRGEDRLICKGLGNVYAWYTLSRNPFLSNSKTIRAYSIFVEEKLHFSIKNNWISEFFFLFFYVFIV